MTIKNKSKEDLELMSYKDITNLILNENKPATTLELFTNIVELLELPKSTIDKQIGDYYTMLTTDKRFLLLDNNKWDLRIRHTSDKRLKVIESEDEEEEYSEEHDMDSIDEDEKYDEEDDFDNQINDDEDFDDGDDDLSDLVIFDPDQEEE